jgi:endonuclease III
MEDSLRVKKIIALLDRAYPEAKIELRYGNSLELLIATMLSAQCTDKMVNKVTERLFKEYRTVKEYAGADIVKLEQSVRSTGFYHNKARNVKAMAAMLLERFGGRVPERMEDLVQLPGVARKTANIVLFNAFGKQEGIAVDTHVKRLSQRLGLTTQEDTDKIEQELMRLVEKRLWGHFTYLLIEHGRAICIARQPKCPECVIGEWCPSKRVFLQKVQKPQKGAKNS